MSTVNKSSGYSVFFEIATPNPTCATIIKSPADTSVQGCGITIGTFQNAACANFDIAETFMVQFCCGEGDCTAAGVPVPGGAKRDLTYQIGPAGGISAATFMYNNGTIIEPAQQGPMLLDSALTKRQSGCSYAAEGEPYTRPADNTQIVTPGGVVSGTITISETRTQEWTTSIDAGINILEIVSAGVSFSISESVSDSTEYSFTAPAGQTGRVGFTANLRCTTGLLLWIPIPVF